MLGVPFLLSADLVAGIPISQSGSRSNDSTSTTHELLVPSAGGGAKEPCDYAEGWSDSMHFDCALYAGAEWCEQGASRGRAGARRATTTGPLLRRRGAT